MNQKLDVALRVMTAIRERTNPLRSDLKSLQTWMIRRIGMPVLMIWHVWLSLLNFSA